MNFKTFWKSIINNEEIILKSSAKLSKSELVQVQNIIHTMQKKGKNAKSIIKYLQDHNSKLVDMYKAERAFWTEIKRMDTADVADSADELDLKEFKVILSPHACPLCLSKTNNGKKVFKSSEITKDGFGHAPPFHPNCYCVIIPK